MNEQLLLVGLAVTLRILVTAAINAVGARYILEVKPVPYGWALGIAASAHLLAKAAAELGLPISMVLPLSALVQLVLPYYAFRPRIIRLLAYWIATFVVYMVIHIILSVLFDLNFLFGVWIVGTV